MRNILLLLIVSFFTNCGGSSTDDITVQFFIKNSSGQETDSFIIGSTETFEITLTNTTNNDISYDFTPPSYDFFVRSNGTEVWSAQSGLAFTQVVTSDTIKASETLTFTATWDGKDNQGNIVSQGIYEVLPSLQLFVNGIKLPQPPAKTITLN